MSSRLWPSALGLALLVGCSDVPTGQPTAGPDTPLPETFEATSTVEETLRQHRALPDPSEEIWWRATGNAMAWRNKNIHQFVPTVTVPRAGQVSELASKTDARITDFEVTVGGKTVRFGDLLESDDSTAMGVVIVHGGEIVFERYPRMQAYERPIWWSVTKVFVSTMVALLEASGDVDVDLPIETYVPRLSDSDFAGISVRNVLDMASGIDCADDDYSDPDTCYMRFEASLGDAERSATSPDNPYDYLAELDVGHWAEPGVGFDYSGTNTFALGWLVEEITGLTFQDALSRDVWRHIGAEADASIYAGRLGIPLTSGGLLARPRDVARFGLLFTPSWSVVNARRIVPETHIRHLLEGGRPQLLERTRSGDASAPEVRHNVFQWDRVFTNGDIYKGGWAGQGLLVNPERDYVAVWVGYSKDDASSEVALLPVIREVLDGVYGE